MPNCTICDFPYNLTTRKHFSCPFCEYEFCRACFVRFLEDRNGSINCPSCATAYTMETVSQVMTKTYLREEYPKLIAKEILEIEKARLPETASLIEGMRQQLGNLKEQAVSMYYDVMETCLRGEYASSSWAVEALSAITNAKIIEVDIDTRRFLDAHKRFIDLQSNTNFLRDALKSVTIPQPSNRPCPQENCKGFLNHKWRCTLCSVRICRSCRVNLGENHECDPQVVASIQLVEDDTKPCPKCKTRISKNGGCDQMWCTQCKTAFSWDKGKIITGAFHNPHFAEYQRTLNEGRVVDLDPCAFVEPGHIDYGDLDIDELIRHAIEMNEVAGTMVQDREDVKFKLRLRFLSNDITEEDWLKELSTMERAGNFDASISEILRTCAFMVRTVTTEWFREKYPKSKLKTLIDEIRDQTNRALLGTLRLYEKKTFIWIDKALRTGRRARVDGRLLTAVDTEILMYLGKI